MILLDIPGLFFQKPNTKPNLALLTLLLTTKWCGGKKTPTHYKY